MNIPTIAILGRPNVGKSTLFNRLIGKNHSIVSPKEGVTRDRVYEKFEWSGNIFNLVDTGGYIPDTEGLIEKQVVRQSELARNEADLIILLVDGQDGITSSDQKLASLIQKMSTPHILVVNKIDHVNHKNLIYVFHELGLGEPFGISAQANRDIGNLLDEVNILLPKNNLKAIKDNECINFAIVGMPNVGKSSLMNRLLKTEKSIVTDIAGTTRDSIDSYLKYYNKDIRVIDTAGLRRKSKISEDIEYYSTVRTMRIIDECDIAAVMIDAKKGFINQDKDIIRKVIDSGKGLMIIVNKWDLIKKETDTMKEFKQDILDYYPMLKYFPILFISVLENIRIQNIFKNILSINQTYNLKIKTQEINKFLKKIVSYYPPPSNKGKNINLKYAVQIQNSPPMFVFFTNYPKLIKISYKRFIENQLREKFNLVGVPIKISFRKKDD